MPTGSGGGVKTVDCCGEYVAQLVMRPTGIWEWWVERLPPDVGAARKVVRAGFTTTKQQAEKAAREALKDCCTTG